MKLSIITINLNNCLGLVNTIKSVVYQTYKDFEWIIVDGGSSDGSKELIEQYHEHIDYWVSEPDKGIYNAMNKGVKVSKGEYLLFLNSGDLLVSKDCIESIINNLSNKDFYVGYELSEKGRRGLKFINKLYLSYFLVSDSLPHQATFIRRELFYRNGFYNESLKIVSDWLFSFENLILRNASICIIKKDICIYDTNGFSSLMHDIGLNEKISQLNLIRLPIFSSIFFICYKLKIKIHKKFPSLYTNLYYIFKYRKNILRIL